MALPFSDTICAFLILSVSNHSIAYLKPLQVSYLHLFQLLSPLSLIHTSTCRTHISNHLVPSTAGEMKHGPLALVDDQMPILVIDTHDPMYHKMVSGVIEILLARNANLLILCNEGDE